MLSHPSLSLCCSGDGENFAVCSGCFVQEGEREAKDIRQEKDDLGRENMEDPVF